MVSSLKQISFTKTTNNNINHTKLKSTPKLSYSGDIVTFTGNSPNNSKNEKDSNVLLSIINFAFQLIRKLCEFLSILKKETGDNKFAKIWLERNNDHNTLITTFSDNNDRCVIFNPEKNIFAINLAKVKNNSQALNTVKTAESIKKTHEKLHKSADNIRVKSGIKLGIPESFIPPIYYFHEESNNLGAYSPGEHYVMLNTYWLEKAQEPETVLSEVIPHELSHAKSNLKFSLIDPKEINISLKRTLQQAIYLKALFESSAYQNYRLYRASNDPVSEKEYNITKNLLERHLSDYKANEKANYAFIQINAKNEDIYSEIQKNTGIGLREISLLDIAHLFKNDQIRPNMSSSYIKAQYSQDEINEIIKKIHKHKNYIKNKLIELYKFQFQFSEVISGYTDIYDEAVARMAASEITGQNIDDGTIEKTESAQDLSYTYRQDILILIIKSDKETRSQIESGKIQLDSIFLDFISQNQHRFGNINLSKQKNLRKY
ncbi:MAG: hypothetical protein AB1782_13680 [Cyanobacteriota bacterium]